MKKLRNILLILCFVLGIGLFAACDDKEIPDDTNKDDETKFVDYVDSTKLNANVTESSSFFEAEGVGLATVTRCVDGDTALFFTGGKEFTARFLGVDTPESTGQVEEWGKTASLFTADKLNNAVSIVVQTDGGAAKLDTTGNRYLTYVWYKPNETADYRLLNLELVQEGLSYAKTANVTLYESQFVLAHNQAKNQGIRMHGDEIDVNFYYGDAQSVTIKYILENQKQMVEDNVKVSFDCTITLVDGMYVYAQDYDAESDIVYSILLYTGYNLKTKKLVKGNRLTITGTVQEYNGYVQIAGMQDIAVASEDNIKFIQKDYEIKVTNITADKLNNATSDMERLLVKLENVKVTSTYTTTEGTSAGAITIRGTVGDKEVSIRTAVLYHTGTFNPVTADYFEGKTISVVGMIETFNGNKQIKVVSIEDITIVE